MTKITQNATTDRNDVNREKRLELIRTADQLLAEACKPNFTGSIVIEMHSQQGVLKTMKSAVHRFGPIS